MTTAAVGDDAPLTAAGLAQRAGLSPNTIRGWAKQDNRPLGRTEHRSGPDTYTVTQLRAFCAEHPGLTGVRRARKRLDGLTTGPEGGKQPEELRSATLNLRIAAQAALDVATNAVRLAEQNAVAHREQVDALALMIRSYDDLLTQLTAPTTLHD